MDSRANFIGFLSIKVPLNFLGKCQIGPDFDWWMACKMPFEIPRGIWVPEKISLAFCSTKSHGKMTQKSHFSRGFLACYRQLALIIYCFRMYWDTRWHPAIFLKVTLKCLKSAEKSAVVVTLEKYSVKNSSS